MLYKNGCQNIIDVYGSSLLSNMVSIKASFYKCRQTIRDLASCFN